VWFGDGRYLLFSDIPNDRILRWDETTGGISVFRNPAHYANGNTRDRQGRLITCEHDTQRVTRTEYDGSVVVLADQWQGRKLTGPNDVVVKSDGTIWFSDNGAGTRGNYLGHTAPQEHPFRVYRLDLATGTMTIAVEDMARPNGLCFSPDESKLYVVDTPGDRPKSTWVYDIVDRGTRAVDGRVVFDGHEISSLSRRAMRPFRREIQLSPQPRRRSDPPYRAAPGQCDIAPAASGLLPAAFRQLHFELRNVPD